MRSPKATFGELVAAVSGLALVLSLFFAWYGYEAGPVEASASGWESLTVIDIALAFVAALAIAQWVARRTGWLDRPRLPFPPAAAVALAGVVALLLALLRIADLPDAVAAAHLDGRRAGSFLAVIASIGIVLGSLAALAPVIPDRDRGPDEPHGEQ